MANINASALNSLQTRINAERSRRGLSPVTFTDGNHGAGDIIKATHFNELRSYTEGLNTLGSQTFNWSGNISVGANITDVLTQIDNFVTTLEGEALASWHSVPVNSSVVMSGGIHGVASWSIPANAQGVTGAVRYKHTVSEQLAYAYGNCSGGGVFGQVITVLANNTRKSAMLSAASNSQLFNYWSYAELMGVQHFAGACSFAEAGPSGTGITNGGYSDIYAAGAEPYPSSFLMTRGILATDPQEICNGKSVSANLTAPHNWVNGAKDVVFHGHGKRTQQNTWRYLAHANTTNFNNFMVVIGTLIQYGVSSSDFTVEAYY